MTEVGWTRNLPIKSGWYWWRNAKLMVVYVGEYPPGSLYVMGFGPLANFDGEFLGPITPDSYQQGRVAALDEVERYMAMRLRLAEASLATEILAGNEVKQGRERAAIAELHGMQRHVSDIKEYLAQQAQGGVGG